MALLGTVFAFTRYQHAMDVYEQAILIGSLPAAIWLAWLGAGRGPGAILGAGAGAGANCDAVGAGRVCTLGGKLAEGAGAAGRKDS